MRQRGTLFVYREKVRGEMWKGRFRVAVGPGKRREVSITLGPVSGLTESQARSRLDEIVAKANVTEGYVKHFGRRGLLKEFSRPADQRFVAPTIKPGNIRGGIGAASELIVCADLVSKGIETYRAVNPQGPCDLLCMFGEKPVRVEVKTESKRGQVQVARNAGNFDVLAIVGRTGRVRYVANHALPGENLSVASWLRAEKECSKAGNSAGFHSLAD